MRREAMRREARGDEARGDEVLRSGKRKTGECWRVIGVSSRKGKRSASKSDLFFALRFAFRRFALKGADLTPPAPPRA